MVRCGRMCGICVEFGGICGDCKVCHPPSSVFPLEVFLEVLLEMVVSATLKWWRILHALFHQENLDLVAMDFWTILALAARGCRSGLDK